jgi:Zn-dependent protease
VNKKKTMWASIGAITFLFISKLKWILVFLKFFKLTTVITIIVSLVAYGLTYGWLFGIALIYILMIHEMGHVWAMKRLNIPTHATLFIPFIGALARGKELAKNAYDDAFISYMGPTFGFLSIIPAILLYLLTGTEFWMLVVLIGSVINLFNLIPITPFDGGHIVKVINFKLVIVGFVFAIAAMFFTKSYTFIFFVFLGFIYVIVFYYERGHLSKKVRKLNELNEFTQSILSAEENKDSIVEMLKQERENFSKLFDPPFVKAIKRTEKEDRGDLQEEVVEIFNQFIQEKRKYYTYLESFSTISKRNKWKIAFVYIALILLLATTTYYGFISIGHELKDININF